jgi:hypothetical protein
MWYFSPPIVHKTHAKMQISWAPMNSNPGRWLEFFTYLIFKSQMPLNMKVVSLDKTHNFYIGRFWSV